MDKFLIGLLGFVGLVVLSWLGALLISFIDAALLLVFLGWSNIPVLAALGYWQLYWLNMAIMMPVSSAIAWSKSSD